MSLRTLNTCIVSAAILVLTACADDPGVASRVREARMEQLGSVCAAYGYQRGTDSFAQCMQATDVRWREEMAQGQQRTHCMLSPASCGQAPTLTLVQPKTTHCTRDTQGGLDCITQ